MQARPSSSRKCAGAGGDVVAVRGERADRTGAEARARDTGLARARRARASAGMAIGSAKRERAAIAVPQAVVGMDQQPERRDMHGLGAHRPTLERPVRRPVEGIERPRPQSPAASAPITRRLQRSSGSARPSRASGEVGEGAPAPRCAGEAPTRTIAWSASSPPAGRLRRARRRRARRGRARSIAATIGAQREHAGLPARRAPSAQHALQAEPRRCDDSRATRKSRARRRSRRAPAG